MDSDAWNILQEHASTAQALLLRLTLRREVAEDLLHDLFVKLVGRIVRADDPAAYMARTAINIAMDWRRQNWRPSTHRQLNESMSAPGQSEIAIENADEIERIFHAAESLSELEQQVFVLRLVQQEPYERVGQILQKTAHQARGICDAAVKHIRRELDKKQVSHERS